MSRKSSPAPNQNKLWILVTLLCVGLGLWFLKKPMEPTRTPLPLEQVPKGKAEELPITPIPKHGGTGEPRTFPEEEFGAKPSLTAPGGAKAPEGSGTTSDQSPSGPLLSEVQQRFQVLANQTLSNLPRLEQLREQGHLAQHGAPPLVRQAAVAMGTLADHIDLHPEVKTQAFEFYQRCSLTPDLIHSLRALCLNRAHRLSSELRGREWEFDPALIPAAVVRLSTRL